MQLEYDANKNPEIFQQLCQLDLRQVIIQVPADSCCLRLSGAVCPASLLTKTAAIQSCASWDGTSASTSSCTLLSRAKQHWKNRLSRSLQR